MKQVLIKVIEDGVTHISGTTYVGKTNELVSIALKSDNKTLIITDTFTMYDSMELELYFANVHGKSPLEPEPNKIKFITYNNGELPDLSSEEYNDCDIMLDDIEDIDMYPDIKDRVVAYTTSINYKIFKQFIHFFYNKNL